MIVKLKEITTISSGVYKKEYPVGDVLYLQIKDMKAVAGTKWKLKPTLPNTASLAKHLLNDRDLLFAAKGLTNYCAIYYKETGPAVASTSFYIIRLKYNAGILPEFLCWYLNSPAVLNALQKKSYVGTIPLITKGMLEETIIQVPNLNFQSELLNYYFVFHT